MYKLHINHKGATLNWLKISEMSLMILLCMHVVCRASSETQGQIVGRRESLNGRKNMTRRKVKNGEKSPWGQCLTRPVPTVAAVLASDWCQKNTSFLPLGPRGCLSGSSVGKKKNTFQGIIILIFFA